MNIKRSVWRGKLKFTKGTIDWREWYQQSFLCAHNRSRERGIDKMLMQVITNI